MINYCIDYKKYIGNYTIKEDYWEEIGKSAACYALRGCRRKMEDRFIILERKYNNENFSLYAVLDGHGGQSVVNFVKSYISTTFFDKIVDIRKKSLENCSYFNKNRSTNLQINYNKLLTDEILILDELLKENSKQSNYEGSTLLLTIIDNNRLIIANVGDSRAIMYNKDNKVIPLSFDHKPIKKRELKRIKDNKGHISFNGVWRVSGILALSRALGDFPLKTKNLIIANPDVLIFDMNDYKPKFIVLATDGLWDVFDNKKVADLIKNRLNETHFGAKTISIDALKNGSRDNITVLVIKF